MAKAPGSAPANVRAVLAELKALGSPDNLAGMARFGINTEKAYGVSVTATRSLVRKYRRQHALAADLWASGVHEARILAALIDDPKLVTPKQMDSWVADFNSWDLCDQVCMNLFAETPHALPKIAKWAKDKREFVRRAAFATMAGYGVHAKKAPDAEFLAFLPIIEKHATDPRNFVRKAVNWALRTIGKRSLALYPPAMKLAEKLAASDDKTARWIGKDAVRELTDPAQMARIRKRG